MKLDEIPLPDAPSNQAGKRSFLTINRIFYLIFLDLALALFQANEIQLPTQKGILKK